MLSKTDLDGNLIIAGSLPISSESKMHYGVYRESGKAGAVFHTHATFATAFACSGKRVNTRMLPELLGSSAKEIPGRPLRPSGNL